MTFIFEFVVSGAKVEWLWPFCEGVLYFCILRACTACYFLYICRMQECDKPYLVNRFGRETYIGWERLYELTPGALADLLLESLQEARLLYYYKESWWKGEEQWCCPHIILDNVFGVIPCFRSEGRLDKLLLVDLVDKESLAEYPATEAKLLLPCKKLLTDGRKILREKGKQWREDYRKGNAYLYSQGECPPSMLEWDFDTDWAERVQKVLKDALLVAKKDVCFNEYPSYSVIYERIMLELCKEMENRLDLSKVFIQDAKEAGFKVFDREVCRSLYDITRPYYDSIPLSRSLRLIVNVLIDSIRP